MSDITERLKDYGACSDDDIDAAAALRPGKGAGNTDARLAALEELVALDQELELKYGLTGNPMIKAQEHMRNPNCCYCEKPHGKSAPLIFQTCDACQDERDRRAIDSSKSLTDEEREILSLASRFFRGRSYHDWADSIDGLLERLK